MAACRMREIFNQHTPVLLNEAVNGLVTVSDGIYVDATFGRGSHAQAILNRLTANGRLIAFDKDPEAVLFAQTHFAHDKRFSIFHCSYALMQKYLSELNLFGKMHGVLFDLGVSSPQLDNPVRGFSFTKEGKLDMRMDTTQGIDAMNWLATIEEQELARIIWEYGEEKFSRRIAHAIVVARKIKPITTTFELANVIKSAIPKSRQSYDKHPATRTFQAMRIAINQELTELSEALMQAYGALQIGGRLAVISFHSLEDRLVKEFIKEYEKGPDLPRGLPIKKNNIVPKLQSIGKPIKPSLQEVNMNPRARSAILRIAEKLS